ncbi:zinc ribbon domain-containing protein [Nocardioides sp.]|uniref:zinc ribbon domain-containing protein n=1 Tax=Nocardioides sp. TaxID=35761 RepID=UPI00271CA6F6|nr:C4-type zinc ribbon domain-containing protein [Nocardioides sp.]MDO9457427.1 C4-type zinc ribbon domain-containing protein [Nocardioides sp.]
MKAPAEAQLRLLDVQRIDSRADQLRHQRASLPEIAEIATLTAGREEVNDQRRDQQVVVDDLTAAQRKADVDVEQVKARRTRDNDRMAQGLVTNPKDLERMQHELASLERRIGTLEDEELEIMEQLEEAQARLDELEQKLTGSDERLAELAVQRDEKTAIIDHELAALETERGPAAEGLPADLVALYDKLRSSKNGVGAAELRQRRCTGCQIGIDNAEIGVIRATPEDTVVRCEECSRILVRTAESGLTVS